MTHDQQVTLEIMRQHLKDHALILQKYAWVRDATRTDAWKNFDCEHVALSLMIDLWT